MNIEKLEVGTIYKNYKTLCADLGEPIKTGKSKQLQIAEWERFFTYKKAGYSFIIESILETPKPKPEGNNTIKYIDKVEKLILDLLVQEGNEGQVFLSKNKMLKALKMVNDNYAFGKSKPFKLSKLINITTEEINDFYETSDSLLKRNLETALDNLRKQALITWKNSLTVCYVDVNLIENQNLDVKATKFERRDAFGDEEVEFGIYQTKQTLVHRKATVEEEQIILRAEREVLKNYDCRSVSDVFKMGKADYFYKDVKEILFDISNIFLYYNSYEIISNPEAIDEEWKLLEKNGIHTGLNTAVIDKLEVNAINRHNNSLRKYDETQSRKYEMRKSDSYLINTKTLTDTLIKKDAKQIRYV